MSKNNYLRQYKDCSSKFAEVASSIDELRRKADSTTAKVFFGRRHSYSDKELETSGLLERIHTLYAQAVALFDNFRKDNSEDAEPTLVDYLHSQHELIYKQHTLLIEALHGRGKELNGGAAKLLLDVAIAVGESANVIPFSSTVLRKIAS